MEEKEVRWRRVVEEAQEHCSRGAALFSAGGEKRELKVGRDLRRNRGSPLPGQLSVCTPVYAPHKAGSGEEV